MSWWRKLFGLCEHTWETRFWGLYSHGVRCTKCGKGEFRPYPSPVQKPGSKLTRAEIDQRLNYLKALFIDGKIGVNTYKKEADYLYSQVYRCTGWREDTE